MAEAGETLRTGPSSASGTRSSSTRPEWGTVKADPETGEHGSDFGHRSTKTDLTDAEIRKRTLVETTSTDDDEPAEKYWRDEDFAAKASMDELTGSWLADEHGIFDHDVAEDTWAACQGQYGEIDKQAEAEATEKAPDSLLAHGVVEDMKREDATTFKSLTTRWELGWRMRDGEWKTTVRFVGRDCAWAEHREDLFSLGATHSAGRVTDCLALKLGLETFEAYARLNPKEVTDASRKHRTTTSRDFGYQ